MSREIMQQALATLKNCLPVNYCYNNFGDASPMYKKDGLSVEKINESIKALEAELAKPEQKGISSGLCLHPSALNYLDKKKVRTRLDYQPYTGVGEALEKELGESNES